MRCQTAPLTTASVSFCHETIHKLTGIKPHICRFQCASLPLLLLLCSLFSCHSPKRKATLDTLVESDRNFIGAHLRALLALKYKLAAATRLHLHLSARGSGFRLFMLSSLSDAPFFYERFTAAANALSRAGSLFLMIFDLSLFLVAVQGQLTILVHKHRI